VAAIAPQLALTLRVMSSIGQLAPQGSLIVALVA
jgi:hypothetical protein